jgi:CheY-like chemotaxis protein
MELFSQHQGPLSPSIMNRILLVEDTETDAALIQRALKLAGITNPIHRICDGAETLGYLEHAERNPSELPSILLLDLNLPKVDGIRILEWLQRRPAFGKMLRIVVSHLDSMQTIKEAYAAGAQSYLTKPLHQSEVNHLIVSFPGYWLFSEKSGQSIPDSARPKQSNQVPTDPAL